MKRLIFIIFASLTISAAAATAETDSLAPLPGNWVKQLIATNFHINDPRINYPKFPDFCRRVYNWGDKTFNSYDPEYVVGTGKNWKAYIKSYNWRHSYVYNFDFDLNNRVRLATDVYSDLGYSVNFMAVSIGYTWNVNKWFHGKSDKRNTFNFSFTSALFTAELNSMDNDTHGRVIQFGDKTPEMPHSSRLSVPVHQKTLNFCAYYFFNHNHYSHAAAYCYSKYQKKSAGSWILGLEYNKQNLKFNFSALPTDLIEAMPDLPLSAHYKYQDYDLIGGYGHNLALPHGWLINLTFLPAIGYKRWPDNTREVKEMISAGVIAKSSFTYNHRALFASALLNFNGKMMFTSKYGFFNSTESATAIVGFRF